MPRLRLRAVALLAVCCWITVQASDGLPDEKPRAARQNFTQLLFCTPWNGCGWAFFYTEQVEVVASYGELHVWSDGNWGYASCPDCMRMIDEPGPHPEPQEGGGEQQVPTSLQKTGTDTTTSPAQCTAGTSEACGVTRTFKYQVLDQNGQPIKRSMLFSDAIKGGSPNGCNLTSYNTTPPDTYTFPDGTFNETLRICAPACRSGSMCITGCTTAASQTWTVDGVALNGDVKSLSYQCDKILVNGG